MKQFKDIICVVDSDTAYEYLLERAVALAENNQASLTVVDITEKISADMVSDTELASASDMQSAMTNTAETLIEDIIAPYRERLDIKTKVLTGIPFMEIIREVLRGGHDIVIKLADMHDWLDNIFSSDDMHLFRKCPCPVWIIKPQEKKTYKRILVSVDIDNTSSSDKHEAQQALNEQTLELACSLALSDFAELHVVYVWHAVGESAMRGAFMDTPEEKILAYTEQVRQQRSASLNKLLQDVLGKSGEDFMDYIKPQVHLIKGWARKEIPALAKRIDADLVVMGTVARTGIHGFFMGNTAETILNQIDSSVLAIKPPGFETPVTMED